MSALLTFLGGSAFRAIWGEASAWLQKRQDHKHELEMMRLQGDLEAAQHARQQEAIRLQAELGVKTIEAQRVADVARADAEGFYTVSAEAQKPSGVAWVDALNALIRPLIAFMCLVLWVRALNQAGFVLTDWDREIICGVFGFWFANRVLANRGK